MLIIALVLALIGLVALVFAVVTSNELVAWVCIGASVLGVVLLIIDALRERQRRDAGDDVHDEGEAAAAEDTYEYPEEAPHQGEAADDATKESTVPTERWGAPAEGRGDEPAK